MRLILIAACLALAAGAAAAQSFRLPGGTVVQPNINVPYPMTPLSPGQYGVAPAAATGLTPPAGATMAHVCASTAVVRYTTDGTTAPTSSVGMPLADGACTWLYGPILIHNFKALSAVGTLDVEYFQ